MFSFHLSGKSTRTSTYTQQRVRRFRNITSNPEVEQPATRENQVLPPLAGPPDIEPIPALEEPNTEVPDREQRRRNLPRHLRPDGETPLVIPRRSTRRQRLPELQIVLPENVPEPIPEVQNIPAFKLHEIRKEGLR